MARIDLVDLAHSYGGNAAPQESFALKPVTMTWRQAAPMRCWARPAAARPRFST